jgi:hypothetical protein
MDWCGCGWLNAAPEPIPDFMPRALLFFAL